MPGTVLDRDRYYTPDLLARACTDIALSIVEPWLDSKRKPKALEPHCGEGAFVRALTDRTDWVYSIDLDPKLGHFNHVFRDFLKFRPYSPYDLIIGNPPFSDCEAHLRHALAFTPPSDTGRMLIGFILRLDFLGSLRRIPFWKEFPPSSIHVIRPRPSFTGGGSDMREYAFFIWAKNSSGKWNERAASALMFLDWKTP